MTRPIQVEKNLWGDGELHFVFNSLNKLVGLIKKCFKYDFPQLLRSICRSRSLCRAFDYLCDSCLWKIFYRTLFRMTFSLYDFGRKKSLVRLALNNASCSIGRSLIPCWSWSITMKNVISSINIYVHVSQNTLKNESMNCCFAPKTFFLASFQIN